MIDSFLVYDPVFELRCLIFADVNALGHLDGEVDEQATVKPDRDFFHAVAGHDVLLIGPDKLRRVEGRIDLIERLGIGIAAAVVEVDAGAFFGRIEAGDLLRVDGKELVFVGDQNLILVFGRLRELV